MSLPPWRSVTLWNALRTPLYSSQPYLGGVGGWVESPWCAVGVLKKQELRLGSLYVVVAHEPLVVLGIVVFGIS